MIWGKSPQSLKGYLRKSHFARSLIVFLMDRAPLFRENLSQTKIFEEVELLQTIDVVITTFNQSPYIQEALESLFKQSYPASKIFIINHSEAPAEKCELERIVDGYVKENITLKHIEECWPGSARNFGASLSDSDLIVFLDADDYISTDYLFNTTFYLNLFSLDFIGAWCENFADFEQGREYGDVWKTQLFPSWKNLVESNAYPVTSLIRRSVFEDMGGWQDFDPEGSRQDEAINLWRRLSIGNYKGANIQQKMIFLRRHNHNLSSKAGEREFFQSQQMRKSWEKLLIQKGVTEKRLQGASKQMSINLRSFDLFKVNQIAEKENLLFVLPDKTYYGAGKVIKWNYLKVVDRFETIFINADVQGLGGDLSIELDSQTPRILELGAVFPIENWFDIIDQIAARLNIKNFLSFGHPFINSVLKDLKESTNFKKVFSWMFNIKSANAIWLEKNPNTIDKVFVESDLSFNFLINAGWEKGKVEKIAHNAHRAVETPFKSRSIKVDLEKLKILWLGRFAVEKCPDEFIKLANEMKKQNGMSFTICGEGPLKSQVIDNVAKAKNHHLTYSSDNTISMLYLNDVYVSTSSEIEGRPLTIIEALEAGMIVLAPNSGAITEIQDDGYVGLQIYQELEDIKEFLINHDTKSIKERRTTRVQHNILVSNQREAGMSEFN